MAMEDSYDGPEEAGVIVTREVSLNEALSVHSISVAVGVSMKSCVNARQVITILSPVDTACDAGGFLVITTVGCGTLERCEKAV